MSLDPDILVDRRAMKRRIGFWRILAIIAIVCAVIALLAAAGAFKAILPSQAQVARISISGFISPDRKMLDLLERVAKADEVKGVVIDIDSGGGASVGEIRGNSIYRGGSSVGEVRSGTVYNRSGQSIGEIKNGTIYNASHSSIGSYSNVDPTRVAALVFFKLLN